MLGVRTHVRSHYHASEGGTQGLNPVPTVSLRPHQHEGPNTSGPLVPRRDPPPVSHCPSKPPGPPGLRPWGCFDRDPPIPTLPPGCQPCKDTTQTSGPYSWSAQDCAFTRGWYVPVWQTARPRPELSQNSSRVFQKEPPTHRKTVFNCITQKSQPSAPYSSIITKGWSGLPTGHPPRDAVHLRFQAGCY